MSSSDLVRWGAPATMLGGALTVIANLMSPFIVDFNNLSGSTATNAYAFHHALLMLATLLLLGGIPGLQARQSEAAGRLGWAGFLVAFVGTVLLVAHFWGQAFIAPAVAVEAPELIDEPPALLIAEIMLSFLLFSLGWILFGVSMLRARVYPRVAAGLLIAGAIMPIVLTVPGSALVLGVALTWLGYTLSSRRAEPARQAASVR
ncbi:MAG: hypothetical protein M3R38_27135 [Actinomycetota bacterium]|nr:hypothetical protein [Actinomycetota bacterium]